MTSREELAETIHKARWPADRQMAVTPFADEDRNGREYCFRIADAVLGSAFAQCAPEVDRLRKGIQDYLDGNYASPRDGRAVSPQQKCPHGMFYWDACENCIDEHFSRLLDGMEGRGPRTGLDGGGK